MSDLQSRLRTGVSSIRKRTSSGFLPDDRAVSPIVATIILIALVVVMGGVVASVVFGFGSGTQQTPHAKFTFQYKKGSTNPPALGAGVVYVRDTGGTKLSPSNTLNLTVKDTTQHWTESWNVNSTHSVKAGSTLALGTNHKIMGGDHIVVDWTGPNGKSTSTLAKFDVPK